MAQPQTAGMADDFVRVCASCWSLWLAWEKEPSPHDRALRLAELRLQLCWFVGKAGEN